ncbi:unannotated protein [freshwater metagenome]|uniref:Unannotated protein n=2 Tax=freshwater metagenome TaxID=449393 RepID=A0A6J7NUR8_9ZZZZ
MDNSELDTAGASASDTAATETPAPAAASTETPAPAAASTPQTGGLIDAGDAAAQTAESGEPGDDDIADPTLRPATRKRRRGSRGGKNRKKPRPVGEAGDDAADSEFDDDDDDFDDEGGDDTAETETTDLPAVAARPARAPRAPRPTPGRVAAEVSSASDELPELPERMSEGRPSAEAADKALVRRPQIGDTRPSSAVAQPVAAAGQGQGQGQRAKAKGPRAASTPKADGGRPAATLSTEDEAEASTNEGEAAKKKRRRGGKSRSGGGTGQGRPDQGRAEQGRPEQGGPELDPDVLERRRGRERNGRPIGRYLMCVQVRPNLTQVAVLEGRTLIEHYTSRPADDVSQIHGNIYVGKVQNVLPGMEAAFVDIGTPKNAVLYRGDVQYDAEDIVEKSKKEEPRIEQMLRSKQLIVCQVTKNPIGAKGARLTQEVSLPGRFVVLIPHSKTYGISKRLPDDVRKRLRNILDRVKPGEHGLIVRTAAENATEHELRADMTRLLDQWNVIEAKAKKAGGPALLYREPELAVRVIREEFNVEYRGVVIDDGRLHEDVRGYVEAFNPELADRIEHFDAAEDGLPLFERFHIHEQLHKALDRKVWLPSGGSLIIEHTEALTVIDVNTGKNVGTSNLEETVYRNNLEAAEEVAKQLRLRDIGGIVVIDFIDMEIKDNRRKVVDAFRHALARDKTRTQVFDISELGLVEMTRKRIGEGLLVNFADQCPNCEGRGVKIDFALFE